MTQKPPTSNERKQCWEARDAYFECLDQNGLWLQGLKPSSHEQVLAVDPLHIQAEPDTRKNRELYVCRKSKEGFDRNCLASWVGFVRDAC